MNFENTVKNLKLEKNNSIAQECLNEMLNRQVLFNPGFEQEKERLTSLYDLRLNIAKDINKDKFKEDEISNWESAVENLKKSAAKKLVLNWVTSEFKHFMIMILKNLLEFSTYTPRVLLKNRKNIIRIL